MRGPIDLVYSGNMGMIVTIRTVNGALFMREFRAHAPPGKFLRLNYCSIRF